MRRIKLTVAYDGTNYCGWQWQPNGLSIEEVLNKALSAFLNERIGVIGASRTDSGVHALGNVAVFDTETRIAADKLCYAINQRLPEDIRILDSCEVPPDWHPRKQNCVKTYEYRVMNCRVAVPTERLYTYFYYYPLDEGKMREAARMLIGEHDFASFCSARHQSADTVRTLYSADIERRANNVISLRFCGNGFLYNMVRIITGTLIKVGNGFYPPQEVARILEGRDRGLAGQTAPARGLTLLGIEYEEKPRTEIAASNPHWDYVLDQSRLETEGRSVLRINYCEERELNRLVSRMAHQAYRNGAREIFVRAGKGCALSEDEDYGLYRLYPAGNGLWEARYNGAPDGG